MLESGCKESQRPKRGDKASCPGKSELFCRSCQFKSTTSFIVRKVWVLIYTHSEPLGIPHSTHSMSSNFQLHLCHLHQFLTLKALSLQTQFNTMPGPRGSTWVLQKRAWYPNWTKPDKLLLELMVLLVCSIFSTVEPGAGNSSLLSSSSTSQSQTHTYTEPVVPTGSWPSTATEPYSFTQTLESDPSCKCLSPYKASLMTLWGQ